MAPQNKEEVEERQHFLRVIQAFKNYEQDSKDRLCRSWDYFKQLPSSHQEMLKKNGFEANMKRIEQCIGANYSIIKEFIGENFSLCGNHFLQYVGCNTLKSQDEMK